MYHPVSIDKLSENQLSRLRNGHSVRVKLGNHHRVHLTGHQIRRLHTAHKNGKAMTLTFDPYQMEAHGSGILGDIASKAKAFVQKYHLQNVVNPLIHGVKNAGHRTVEKITRAGHQGIKRGSQMAHSYLNQLQPIEGHGLGGLLLNGGASLANLIGGHGSGEAADVLRGIGGVANFVGVGVAPHHRHHHKLHGRGFLNDLKNSAKYAGKELAKTGVRLGSDYIQNKIEGLGVVKPRRIVGRRRKVTKKGGVLYVAGA